MDMDPSVVGLLSCAVAFIGTVVLRELYMWLRNLIPKSVQCWFCMHKTEVPYNLSNSWHCPKCEQYNGFTKDGDYNKAIDQQYDAKLNFSVSTYGRCKNAWRRETSLCNKCNRNQELKVEQLAKFVPLSERSYDTEIEHFRAQIEKAYALCANCETLLHAVLKREREEYCVPRRLNTAFILKYPRMLGIFLNDYGFRFSVLWGKPIFLSLQTVCQLVGDFLRGRHQWWHRPSCRLSIFPFLLAWSFSSDSQNPRGTWILLLYILIALAMSLFGFLQTRGASVLKDQLRDLALPLLKKHLPTAYVVVIKIRPTALREIAVVFSDYISLLGALICLLAYYRTQRQPILLLFNSLTWLSFLAVSLYQQTGIAVWLPLCQVSIGTISCILSLLVLKDIYAEMRDQQLKQQTFLQPKAPKSMNYNPKHAPNGTSTPRGTPPDSRFSYVDSTFHSVKSAPTNGDGEIPSYMDKWPQKYVGLEPGIRGLNLGPVASRPRDDDVHSLWSANTVNLAGSTTCNPNVSCWSLYSGAPNMTTRSAPVGLPIDYGSLTHFYSANSTCGGQSRPTSPHQTVVSQPAASVHNTSESTMRRRNMLSNTFISPPRLILDSGVGSHPRSCTVAHGAPMVPRGAGRTLSDSCHRNGSSDTPGTAPGICSFQHLYNSSSCHLPCTQPHLHS